MTAISQIQTFKCTSVDRARAVRCSAESGALRLSSARDLHRPLDDDAAEVYDTFISGSAEEIAGALQLYPFLFAAQVCERAPSVEIVDAIRRLADAEDRKLAERAVDVLCLIFLRFRETNERLMESRFHMKILEHAGSYCVVFHVAEMCRIREEIMWDLVNGGLVGALVRNIAVQGTPYFETALDLFGFLLEKGVQQAVGALDRLMRQLNFEVFDQKQLPSINFLDGILKYVVGDLVKDCFFDYFVPQILRFMPNELAAGFKLLESVSSLGYASYLYDNNVLSVIQELFKMDDEFSEPNPKISSFKIMANVVRIDINHALSMLEEPLMDAVLFSCREGQYEERMTSIVLLTAFIPYCRNSDISLFVSDNQILDIFLDMLQTDFDPSFIDILQSFSILCRFYEQNTLISPLSEYFYNIYNSTQFKETIHNIKQENVAFNELLMCIEI